MVAAGWFKSFRHLPALFVAATLLPALALGWLAWIGLAELDRQSARSALEAASLRVASDVRQRLDDLSRLLPELARGDGSSLPDDAVLLTVDDGGVVERPMGRLLYVHRTAEIVLARTAALDAAAARENSGNRRDAVSLFRQAALSTERSTQAAALIGLARNLRRDGRPGEALAVYDRLAALGAQPVLDATADLVARRARCAVLAELGSPDLAAEARALHADLLRPKWRLDRAGFQSYLNDVSQWLPPDVRAAPIGPRLALTEAVTAVKSLRSQAAGAQDEGWMTTRVHDTSLVIVWRRTESSLTALLAGSSWLTDRAAAWTADNLVVALVDADDRVAFGRSDGTDEPVLVDAATSTLPWTVRVAYDDPAVVPSLLARSRNLMLAAFLAGGLLFVAGGVLVSRALSRELAVARLQSDFVAAVSHEFRSPLTSMKHLIEMLAQGAVPSDDRRQRYYEVLDGETDRLRHLVEDLLDFGRMESGTVAYQFDRVDIRSIVGEAAADFRRDPNDGERLVADLDGPAVTVAADREALTRAVRNLLDNAAKYSPAAAPIRLEVEAHAKDVEVRVRDEGPGIPAEEQKRIFTKFYRGPVATRAGIKGTGLGLATVLHLVQAHRGKVRVHSTPGDGSTFTIVLPIAEEVPT